MVAPFEKNQYKYKNEKSKNVFQSGLKQKGFSKKITNISKRNKISTFSLKTLENIQRHSQVIEFKQNTPKFLTKNDETTKNPQKTSKSFKKVSGWPLVNFDTFWPLKNSKKTRKNHGFSFGWGLREAEGWKLKSLRIAKMSYSKPVVPSPSSFCIQHSTAQKDNHCVILFVIPSSLFFHERPTGAAAPTLQAADAWRTQGGHIADKLRGRGQSISRPAPDFL